MPKYVAFLRAINVGGHLVKMDYLRSLFENFGFPNAETFIASGNVIFDSKAKDIKTLESKIEKNLEKELGYKVATFIRTTSEVAEVAAHKAFTSKDLNTDGNIVYIGFVKSEPEQQAKQKLLALSDPVNDFHFRERELYWLRRTKVGESQYAGQLFEKTLGQQVTFRNVTTVRKIAAKY